MSENEKLAITLLQEKCDLLVKVLSLTEKAELSDTDAEKYVELMDSRQVHFERIYEIDELLKGLGYDIMDVKGSAQFMKEAGEIYNASRAVAFRITELDKANKVIEKQIVSNFKNEFKSVNQGRNARNLYTDVGRFSDGHYFDKSK